jgi:hypothetical protein
MYVPLSSARQNKESEKGLFNTKNSHWFARSHSDNVYCYQTIAIFFHLKFTNILTTCELTTNYGYIDDPIS